MSWAELLSRRPKGKPPLRDSNPDRLPNAADWPSAESIKGAISAVLDLPSEGSGGKLTYSEKLIENIKKDKNLIGFINKNIPPEVDQGAIANAILEGAVKDTATYFSISHDNWRDISDGGHIESGDAVTAVAPYIATRIKSLSSAEPMPQDVSASDISDRIRYLSSARPLTNSNISDRVKQIKEFLGSNQSGLIYKDMGDKVRGAFFTYDRDKIMNANETNEIVDSAIERFVTARAEDNWHVISNMLVNGNESVIASNIGPHLTQVIQERTGGTAPEQGNPNGVPHR